MSTKHESNLIVLQTNSTEALVIPQFALSVDIHRFKAN